MRSLGYLEFDDLFFCKIPCFSTVCYAKGRLLEKIELASPSTGKPSAIRRCISIVLSGDVVIIWPRYTYLLTVSSGELSNIMF